MKIQQAQEDKLLDYIDGTLMGNDREIFEQAIASNPLLKKRLDELQQLDTSLRSVKIEQPSKNFTQLVMNRLDQYPAQAKSFTSRNGILLLVGVLVAVGIGSLLVAGGVFDSTSTLDLNQAIKPNKYIQNPLPSISINGKLIVNSIILLNIGLAFLVLDRAVLKPWFEKRARMHGMG